MQNTNAAWHDQSGAQITSIIDDAYSHGG